MECACLRAIDNQPHKEGEKIASKSNKKHGSTSSISQIANEELGGIIKEKVVLSRVAFSITPQLKQEFEESARALGMNLTEFLRRAGRAAQENPDALLTPRVEDAEAEYKEAFRPSRWTREPDRS